jgi:serine/threonine-protein kinase
VESLAHGDRADDDPEAIEAVESCRSCRHALDAGDPLNLPPPVAWHAGDGAAPANLLPHLTGGGILRGGRSVQRPPPDAVAGAIARVDRYDLLAVVGRGAMGTTFRAWDAKLRREVAVKVVDMAGAAAVAERVLREARACAAIDHPGVVAIHEAGVDDATGLGFIVSAFIEGQTLEAKLDASLTLPWRAAVEIAREILTTLSKLHPAGIVHRDLKPSNVMIGADAPHRVRLLDFGIARDGPADGPPGVSGTPAYMSPEQAAGHDGHDPRSDLYAVGVCLHQMLTGELPAPGQSLAFDAPPNVRANLRSLLDRALHRDRAARFQSADEMLAALGGVEAVTSSGTSSSRPVDLAAALQHRTVFLAAAERWVGRRSEWFDAVRRISFSAAAPPGVDVDNQDDIRHAAMALAGRRRWDIRAHAILKYGPHVRVEAIIAARHERFLSGGVDTAPSDGAALDRALSGVLTDFGRGAISTVVLVASPTGWDAEVFARRQPARSGFHVVLYDTDRIPHRWVDQINDEPSADWIAAAAEWARGELAHRPALSVNDVAARFGAADAESIFHAVARIPEFFTEVITGVGKVLRRRD